MRRRHHYSSVGGSLRHGAGPAINDRCSVAIFCFFAPPRS